MLNKILHNKFSYLLIIFIVFILIGAIILKWIMLNTLNISNYLYSLHITSWIITIYVLHMLYKDIEIHNIDYYYIFKKSLIFIIIWVLLYSYLSLINYLITLFIVFSIIFINDWRISFLIALLLLLYTVFHITIWDKKLAEQFSIYAYYFLVIWVWIEILSSVIHRDKTIY